MVSYKAFSHLHHSAVVAENTELAVHFTGFLLSVCDEMQLREINIL